MRGALRHGQTIYRQNEDHPRGCGEHNFRNCKHEKVSGSSPRMRGALLKFISASPKPGIIPADAGSTQSAHISRVCGTDHPRGCGEHKRDDVIFDIALGSSPRMRGALAITVQQFDRQWIIPADAGSTINLPSRSTSRADHPRGCGEHNIPTVIHGEGKGSSPRMRGARPSQAGCLPGPRIIPADAGSTTIRAANANYDRDHPRGCGEHQSQLTTAQGNRGSSPRMRGALGKVHVSYVIGGIIPADAGSTWRRACPRCHRLDHPRGCGEHHSSGCSLRYV